MKVIKLLISLLFSYSAYTQNYSPVLAPIRWNKGKFDTLHIPFGPLVVSRDASPGEIRVSSVDSNLYWWTGSAWRESASSGSGDDLSNYIQKQSQNPTATLTGGETRELMSSGADISYSLSWSGRRLAGNITQLSTASITNITVAGVSETFSNPSPGATVSGTQSVTVVRNTNTTFTNTVTTSDSKTASATTSVIFLPKRYWFYSTSTTPTSSDVIAALGGGSELSSSISKSNFTITVSGGNKSISFAYPSSEGTLSSINIGGFESILSFTERTVSVTNASGYSQNYFVYTSNNLLPTTTINSTN